MKRIVITGTSRGIGYELALRFAEAGWEVLALSRQTPRVLMEHPSITCLSVDFGAADAFERVAAFLSEWGGIDALVHNAGRLVARPFAELTAADFQSVYQVNVFAVAALTQVCLPYLMKGSHVVSISSMGGVQGAAKFPGLAAYSSSKAALIGLSELLAEEYKEAGIAFNVLALGAVQTEMLEEAFPGYKAPVTAAQMADYIFRFTIEGHHFHNGKILEVSVSTP
ncbi:MAG TPA: SDR family NAD(P)-dependent oxidoreductase [Flavobacterium sp.]|nr:SDR family NAD(P)-dependent oxidoreductase [Flavobacterium sp.]